MVIDAHRHFWHYTDSEFGWIDNDAIRRDFLPESCAGMDACIAVQARQSVEETKWLLSLAERHDFIKGVVGWVPLASPGLPDVLDSLCGDGAQVRGSGGLVGLRHVVQDEPDDAFILREDFNRGVREVLSRGFSYDILVFERHLENAVKFVDMHRADARFVLDHLGKPHSMEPWRSNLRELAKRENVMCKLSGLVTEVGDRSDAALFPYLEAALEAFGPWRVMFGSDWPVVTAHMPYSEWRGAVMRFLAPLSPSEREAVMGGNAEGFYLNARQR